MPDIRYLIKLPEGLPLDGAASVVSAALYAFNVADDIRDHFLGTLATTG